MVPDQHSHKHDIYVALFYNITCCFVILFETLPSMATIAAIHYYRWKLTVLEQLFYNSNLVLLLVVCEWRMPTRPACDLYRAAAMAREGTDLHRYLKRHQIPTQQGDIPQGSYIKGWCPLCNYQLDFTCRSLS